MSESAIEDEQAREGYKWIQLGPKKLSIPREWDVRRFGDVFDKRRESIEAKDEESVRYVGLDDLESGNIYLQDYDENGADRSSDRGFREGDVLFGKLRPYLNKAAVALFDGICSSDLIPIYATDEADDDFLIYLMHSKVMRDRAIATMSGTNLPRTSWGDIASTRFPHPPVSEQRRIAAVLSTVDEEIQQTGEIIKTAEDTKQGLEQDLVLGHGLANDYQTIKLGPQSVQVPAEWSRSTFEGVATIEKGNTPKTSNDEYYGGDIIWVTPDDLSTLYEEENGKYIDDSDRKLTQAGLESTSVDIVDPDSVMFTSRSYGIGKTAICTVPAATNQGIIAFKPNSEMSVEYLYHYLNWIMDYIISLSGVSTFPEISKSDVSSISVPIPTPEHQDRIIEVLKQADEKIALEREHKQKLQELRRGLMQDLLTGDVRVPESIEPT
jgi:type I restriction enzyme S subunit